MTESAEKTRIADAIIPDKEGLVADLKAVVQIADELIGTNDLDALMRKAIEFARSNLRVERCSILLNHGHYLQGTFGTDLVGHTTYERNIRHEMDDIWRQRFAIWSSKSSHWIIDYNIAHSSPDARMAEAGNFWGATTPIKGADNRIIAVFCNDCVISGTPPDERRQDIIAVYCSILGNIIERQRGMDELQQRDQVLDGVARAASQLLLIEDLDAAIRESLRILGEAMNVDRVYIFKNVSHPLTGERMMTQRYEWVRVPGLSQMQNDDLQDLPYEPSFSMIYDTLAGGHTYGGLTHTLSAPERDFLEKQEIQSILLVPIHINNTFWGFIGFDDCHAPREWSHNEKVILLAMAGNIGGAISRQITETELKARDRILDGVARANHELLTNPDGDEALAESLKMLAAAVRVDRIFLAENSLDTLHRKHLMCLRYVHDRQSAETSRHSGADRSIQYEEQLPGWYDVLSAGRSIHGRLLDLLNTDSDQVRSVLIAPLMIEKTLWGVLAFDAQNQEYRWSEGEVSTLSTMAGSISAAISRRRAEQSLRTSEEHFRTLIESASDIILEVHPSGGILYGSPSVERVLGYTDYELANLNLFDVIDADHLVEFKAMLLESGATPRLPVLQEFLIRHRSGEWRHVECALKSIHDEDGPQRFVINARDITARVRTEEALRRSEELFRQSQKMEAVGRLAGGIAHDFNNLLTAILGYGDLLKAQVSTEQPWRKEIDQIYRAAERAHSLTRQLLAFSRRQVLDIKTVDLNTIVTDMEQFMVRLLGETITLTVQTPTEPCLVLVDRSQMEQVIINLGLNARDAMPDGGQLGIATERVELPEGKVEGSVSIKPGVYARLTVSDSGHGISDAIKPLIFEPFFTTKEVGKGTGLGLSMIHGTVEQCRGQILFHSEEGRGTKFFIYLPWAEAPEETPPEPAETPVSLEGDETVLLLEDDAIVRELSTRILTDKGYRVITRENGKAGLDYFRNHADEIDLVLTDIIMPEMSGLAFARAAREIRPDLPVLFISGYSEDQQPENHEMADGRHFIQKPFTVDTLCRRIREMLDADSAKSRTS